MYQNLEASPVRGTVGTTNAGVAERVATELLSLLLVMLLGFSSDVLAIIFWLTNFWLDDFLTIKIAIITSKIKNNIYNSFISCYIYYS